MRRLSERKPIGTLAFPSDQPRVSRQCPIRSNSAGGNMNWIQCQVSYISNDILAAIGRVQLKKLSQFIARRKQIWDRYQSEFAEFANLTCPPEPLPGTTSSYYLYWIQLPRGRDELAGYLSENGVYTTFRYYPLHMVKYFQAQCSLPGRGTGQRNDSESTFTSESY